jgi:hypothetical protein
MPSLLSPEITTLEEYDAACARIDELMDAIGGSAEGEELDHLVNLVLKYEGDHP